MEKSEKNERRGQSKKVTVNPIAYVIEDKIFGKLEVKNSANAWWLDRGKVERLMDTWKMDASETECLFYSGISDDQYKYFLKMHPHFSAVKVLIREGPNLKARKTIYNSLDNPETAKWYLERKKKNEFGTSGAVTAVQLNIGGDVISDAKVKKLVDEFEEKLKETYKQEVFKESGLER